MSSSKESSRSRDWTHVSHIAGGFFTVWAIYCVFSNISGTDPAAMKWAQTSEMFITSSSQWHWSLDEHKEHVWKGLMLFDCKWVGVTWTVWREHPLLPYVRLHALGSDLWHLPLVITCHCEGNTGWKISLPSNIFHKCHLAAQAPLAASAKIAIHSPHLALCLFSFSLPP